MKFKREEWQFGDFLIRCPKCGDFMLEKITDGDQYYCESCNEFFDGNDLPESSFHDEDETPICCRTCGGPYPDCADSCNILED